MQQRNKSCLQHWSRQRTNGRVQAANALLFASFSTFGSTLMLLPPFNAAGSLLGRHPAPFLAAATIAWPCDGQKRVHNKVYSMAAAERADAPSFSSCPRGPVREVQQGHAWTWMPELE